MPTSQASNDVLKPGPAQKDGRKLEFGDRWNDAAPEDELRLIRKIGQTKEELKRREVELFNLRARRAPVTRLTDDVLALIFEYSAEVIRPPASALLQIGSDGGHQWCVLRTVPFQMFCMQVCRRWKAVALRTPLVWANYAVEDIRALEYAKCFTSKQGVPFGLSLRPTCSDSRSMDSFLAQTATFIQERVHHILRLDLEMCPQAASTLLGLLRPELRYLTKMSLVVHYGTCFNPDHGTVDWKSIELPSIQGLRELHLKNYGLIFGLQSQPSFSIRRLSLTCVETRRPGDLFEVVQSMPCLEELNIILPHCPQPFGSVTPPSSCLPLKKLKTLQLTGHTPPGFLRALPVLTLATLQVLTLEDVEPTEDAVQLLAKIQGVKHLRIAGSTLVPRLLEALQQAALTEAPLLEGIQAISVSAPELADLAPFDKLIRQNVVWGHILRFLKARRDSGFPLLQLQVYGAPRDWERLLPLFNKLGLGHADFYKGGAVWEYNAFHDSD